MSCTISPHLPFRRKGSGTIPTSERTPSAPSTTPRAPAIPKTKASPDRKTRTAQNASASTSLSQCSKCRPGHLKQSAPVVSLPARQPPSHRTQASAPHSPRTKPLRPMQPNNPTTRNLPLRATPTQRRTSRLRRQPTLHRHLHKHRHLALAPPIGTAKNFAGYTPCPKRSHTKAKHSLETSRHKLHRPASFQTPQEFSRVCEIGTPPPVTWCAVVEGSGPRPRCPSTTMDEPPRRVARAEGRWSSLLGVVILGRVARLFHRQAR